jgi:hypothetical protein
MNVKIDKIFFLKVYIFLFGLFYALYFIYITMGNALFFSFPGIYSSLTDSHRNELAYNALLLSRGSWDVTLLEGSSLAWDEKRIELLWDTLYVQSGSHDTVKSNYELALTLEYSKRLEAKLTALSSITSSWMSQSSSLLNTGSMSTGEMTDIYSDQIWDAKMRIKEDGSKRWVYIQKWNDQNILRDTIDFLDLGAERIDW